MAHRDSIRRGRARGLFSGSEGSDPLTASHEKMKRIFINRICGLKELRERRNEFRPMRGEWAGSAAYGGLVGPTAQFEPRPKFQPDRQWMGGGPPRPEADHD